MRCIIFACTDPMWDEEIRAAKARDEKSGMRDRCYYLCQQQASQHARGYRMVEVFRNIYGWCVRDVNNDGDGRLSPNYPDADEAIMWAWGFYSADPARCEVISRERGRNVEALMLALKN